MKLGSYLFLLLLLACLAAPQPSRAQSDYQQLAKLVSPPGTILVGNSLWLDETEVANIHWLEYLHFLHKDSTERQYRAALPDTTVWAHIVPNDPYMTYYLRYPGFRYYPVVGITQTQATAYCHWRSALVNQRMHSEEYLRQHPRLRQYEFEVEYRLPTIREWERAAAGSLDPTAYPYGRPCPPVPGSKTYRRELAHEPAVVAACLPTPTIAYQPGTPIFLLPFNVRERFYVGSPRQALNCPDVPKFSAKLQDGDLLTTAIYENPPNAYGLYNLIGNVAELTAASGLAKGGSFEHSTRDFTIQTNFPYTQPQEWLGFRCACTVRITPKR